MLTNSEEQEPMRTELCQEAGRRELKGGGQVGRRGREGGREN